MAHSIGKTIAELRKAKGWTQIELAEKLNVSDKAVSKWESEGGFPEITQLPVLAKIFDVSIDYLMTGKETEPEIITMSKIELCAKNDDVELFETLSYEYLKTADENGKTILDYMLQYDCVKVVNAFFKKYPVKTIQQSNGYRAGSSLWHTDKVLEILIVNNLVNELLSINLFTRITGRQTIATEWNIYTKKYRTLIFTHEKVSDKLKELYLQAFNESEFNMVLCLFAENKKECDIKLVWKVISSINDTNIKIKITIATLQKLLDNGYIDIVKQANETNKKIGVPTISEESIQVAVLKQSGGSSEEINILSVTQSGIINIDKLLEQKDFKFIKKMFNEYPIHLIEQLNDNFQQKKWRALFQYAIDNNDNALADTIIKSKQEEIENQLLSYWSGSKAEKFNINKKHLYLIENGRKVDLIAPIYGTIIRNRAKNLEEVITKLQAVKQRILDELSLKLDKEKTIGDLTKEYFESELAKGNVDMVIIKLCVRLEAILRSDYHYEGDFSEMLNQYCSRFNTYDDEDNNYDPYTPKKLHKLRMQRNGIVHSEKCNEKLTLEEIKWCIDYICKMG